jgi:hypothetical protein
MDSSSVSFRYTRIQAYAGTAGPSKALPDKPGQAATSSPARACDGQSKDGDTFTLSLEARILQVSITQSDGGGGADASNALAAAQNGDDGSGLVNALMKAVKDLFGQDGSADQGAADGVEGKKHHGHHHALKDPQDVADRVLKHLENEYAQSGGTRQDFADEVKKRMANRQASSQANSYGGSNFRGQVDALVSSGLEAWMQGGSDSKDQA